MVAGSYCPAGTSRSAFQDFGAVDMLQDGFGTYPYRLQYNFQAPDTLVKGAPLMRMSACTVL
jgi:hypothetical protein